MRKRLAFALVMMVAASVAVADDLVLPIFALHWPGKSGNRWTSEIFLTNPGSRTVRFRGMTVLPGVVETSVPCLPPIPEYREVPPYTTVMLSAMDLFLALGCPDKVLGGLTFTTDGPARISSRIVNERGGTGTGGPLAGLGQDLPAFSGAELSLPGTVYQLPGLLWDPLRCARPPAFEVYLYLVNPSDTPTQVTLQQSRNGRPDKLVINGTPVDTPHTFTMQPQEWRQLRVEYGGALPAVCAGPMVVDLFFVAQGGVAVVGSVVDRSSQDPRTVLPVRTSD
ncbi:MAG: hypothetical protein LAO05_01795 [Acidobacteriia bacterium]|nr:hypothetical protein [Terriglobia bacterium]